MSEHASINLVTRRAIVVNISRWAASNSFAEALRANVPWTLTAADSGESITINPFAVETIECSIEVSSGPKSP